MPYSSEPGATGYAAEHWVYAAELDEENPAVSSGSASTAWADFSNWSCCAPRIGHELVIPAKKARRQYLDLIP